MNSKTLMTYLAIAGFALATSAASETMQTVYDGEFPRLDFETVMPTGQSVRRRMWMAFCRLALTADA